MFFIINTLTQEELKKKSGHWVVFFVDQENKTAGTYDPQPGGKSEQLQEIAKKIPLLIDDGYKYKIKQNLILRQPVESYDCGLFCVLFILRYLLTQDYKFSSMYKDPEKNQELINSFKFPI